jgi:hypothetical protein
MRCEVCQGSGVIVTSRWEQPTPCAECHGFAVPRNSEACPDVRQPEFWLIDRRADFTIGYEGWDTQTK